ncbi:membrane metallo-endopeptidase-like 1 isoform X2 [Paramacrobiotus metropolitanus]|nr:membrane metallo-endopeptidase-like 1 isoform X2 [Paramacrobiotus metropolitanus]XP_055347256.1 membrane metallo-endopeptidase-like 1 isoform X2 [Paramacrobiotus metropolitanus]
MRQSSTNVCMTDLCQQIARETISSMDETFDPCVDFYAYACNRWNSSNGLANEVIAPMIREQLQELFDSGNYTNPTEKKAIDVYDQCISQKRGHSSGGGSLVRVLDDVMGGWSLLKDHYNVSSFRLDDTLVRLQQNDIRTFSDLTVNRNEFSSEENILFFTPPSRLFGRWRLGSLINAHYKPTVRNATAQLMKIWSPVVLRLLIEANTNVHRPTVEKRLEKALMLDVTLAKGSTELVLHRKRLTFGDLKRPPFRSRFLANFLSLFNTMLKASSVEFHATPATQFGVQPQLEYLINLDHTMAQLECEGDAGLATLVDWLWWTALYHLVYRETGTCVELVKAAMPLTVSGMFSRHTYREEPFKRQNC